MGAAPVAVAVESVPPPEHVLNLSIMTDSGGVRLDRKGDPNGWPSIYEKFRVRTNLQPDTGFEPENEHAAATIPEAWQTSKVLWRNP